MKGAKYVVEAKPVLGARERWGRLGGILCEVPRKEDLGMELYNGYECIRLVDKVNERCLTSPESPRWWAKTTRQAGRGVFARENCCRDQDMRVFASKQFRHKPPTAKRAHQPPSVFSAAPASTGGDEKGRLCQVAERPVLSIPTATLDIPTDG